MHVLPPDAEFLTHTLKIVRFHFQCICISTLRQGLWYLVCFFPIRDVFEVVLSHTVTFAIMNSLVD